MATVETHAYLVIQIQLEQPDDTPELHSAFLFLLRSARMLTSYWPVAGPASPEELKRLAGLIKDGGWGDAKNPDFIRSVDHGYWGLKLTNEAESVRFRAWLLNTFASMVREALLLAFFHGV